MLDVNKKMTSLFSKLYTGGQEATIGKKWRLNAASDLNRKKAEQFERTLKQLTVGDALGPRQKSVWHTSTQLSTWQGQIIGS